MFKKKRVKIQEFSELDINSTRELSEKVKAIELGVKISENELVLISEGKHLVLLTNHPYVIWPSMFVDIL